MKTKITFSSILISFLFFLPLFALADGGMIVWPPKIHLDQSAQNAIVAWAKNKEVIILSNDIESSARATILRMIPLPSNPEIKEGNFQSFKKLVEIINEKLVNLRQKWLAAGKGEARAPSPGVKITFQKVIGAHNITVVKVNDLEEFLDWIENFAKEKNLELKEISPEFKEGVANYLKREINYFVFDVIKPSQEKESIKPLIYKFSSEFLYYPILITGASEVGKSRARLDVFLITENAVPSENFYLPRFRWAQDAEVELTKEELKEVSPDLADLFISSVKVRKISYYGAFNTIEKDLVVFPQEIWQRDLGRGHFGEDVKALQKILINEGLWDSEVKATGFFGPITQAALIKFQEKQKDEILEPIGLDYGTGYFGEKSRAYLKKLSIKEKRIKWTRNLKIGMKGNDVKILQEILVKEGVWPRPEISPTGYFGPITQKAVIKFQEKYKDEILKPLRLEFGTGFVGPKTRNFLAEMAH